MSLSHFPEKIDNIPEAITCPTDSQHLQDLESKVDQLWWPWDADVLQYWDYIEVHNNGIRTILSHQCEQGSRERDKYHYSISYDLTFVDRKTAIETAKLINFLTWEAVNSNSLPYHVYDNDSIIHQPKKMSNDWKWPTFTYDESKSKIIYVTWRNSSEEISLDYLWLNNTQKKALMRNLKYLTKKDFEPQVRNWSTISSSTLPNRLDIKGRLKYHIPNLMAEVALREDNDSRPTGRRKQLIDNIENFVKEIESDRVWEEKLSDSDQKLRDANDLDLLTPIMSEFFELKDESIVKNVITEIITLPEIQADYLARYSKNYKTWNINPLDNKATQWLGFLKKYFSSKWLYITLSHPYIQEIETEEKKLPQNLLGVQTLFWSRINSLKKVSIWSPSQSLGKDMVMWTYNYDMVLYDNKKLETWLEVLQEHWFFLNMEVKDYKKVVLANELTHACLDQLYKAVDLSMYWDQMLMPWEEHPVPHIYVHEFLSDVWSIFQEYETFWSIDYYFSILKQWLKKTLLKEKLRVSPDFQMTPFTSDDVKFSDNSNIFDMPKFLLWADYTWKEQYAYSRKVAYDIFIEQIISPNSTLKEEREYVFRSSGKNSSWNFIKNDPQTKEEKIDDFMKLVMEQDIDTSLIIEAYKKKSENVLQFLDTHYKR